MKKYMKTGIPGLDEALFGGIPETNCVVVEGRPGTGKTTFGMQFLYEGALKGEPGIYITFEEFPEQIEKDMLDYGWDLQKLKNKNLLKIVTFTPDIFVKQMMEPEGIFEKMIQLMSCKRAVIDSLSVLSILNGNALENRQMVYSLRNSLKKNGLTTLIINEEGIEKDRITPFEHYVFDGIINLYFKISTIHENFRERYLEILKMRGTEISKSRYIFRFLEDGIHLIQPYKTLHHAPKYQSALLSSGIENLDTILGGGIPNGSIFLLETDSRSIDKWFIGSIACKRILENDRFIYLLPSTVSIEDRIVLTAQFGIDLEDRIRKGQGLFIEQFHRAVPPEFDRFVYNVSDYTDEEYWKFLNDTILPIICLQIEEGENWFINYDINSTILKRSEDFVQNIYGEFVSIMKDLRLTCLISCNTETLTPGMISLLEDKADGVFRTWTDSEYQYLQVMKSPNGSLSHPFIVESIPNPPFMRLL